MIESISPNQLISTRTTLAIKTKSRAPVAIFFDAAKKCHCGNSNPSIEIRRRSTPPEQVAGIKGSDGKSTVFPERPTVSDFLRTIDITLVPPAEARNHDAPHMWRRIVEIRSVRLSAGLRVFPDVSSEATACHHERSPGSMGFEPRIRTKTPFAEPSSRTISWP